MLFEEVFLKVLSGGGGGKAEGGKKGGGKKGGGRKQEEERGMTTMVVKRTPRGGVMCDEIERLTLRQWEVERKAGGSGGGGGGDDGEDGGKVEGKEEENVKEEKGEGVDGNDAEEGGEGSTVGATTSRWIEPKNTRERCRRAARRLAARGEVVVAGEDGKVVEDTSFVKGGMEIRLP